VQEWVAESSSLHQQICMEGLHRGSQPCVTASEACV